MTLKTKIAISVIALATSFSLGRYSNGQPDVKKETETNITKDHQTDKNSKRTTTIVTDPDGKRTETTVVDTNTTTRTVTDIDKRIQTEIIAPKLNTLNISALAGVDTMNSFKPVYGLSVSKSFIGPITGGAFGLTNGTIGVSVGLNF